MSAPFRLGAVAALGAAALALTACGPTSPSTSEPIDGGTLVIGETGDTSEMDPHTSYFDIAWRVQDLVYDSLVTAEGTDIVPSIAESWTVDGNVYTFTLRDGVTFSNGRALTTDDVIGSLERLLDPDLFSYWTPQLGPVESITALDESTVQVTLSTPWEPFLAALASISAAILPMEELEAGDFDPTTDMLGSGPFVYESHVQDQEWTLAKNDEYWDADAVAIDDVTVKIIPDDAARLAGLRDGSLDIAYFLGPDSATLLGGIPNVEATVQASSDQYWLILNAVNPESPFVDPAQRAAVATSIDRDGLIANALAGQGQATGAAAANIPGACTPDGLPTYGGGVEAAQQFIADEGIEPAEFRLISPPYGPVFTDVTEYLQQGFTAAGFTANIETPEIGSLIERVYVQNPADFDATVDYLAGYLSPMMMVQSLLVDPELGGGFAGFAAVDTELNDLVHAASSEADPDTRADLVQQVCEHIATSANIIPLSIRSTTIGVRTDQVDADIPEYDGYDVFLRNLPSYVKLG